MEDYKIEANETFFGNVINVLNDGGVYCWKDKPHIPFRKHEGKLATNTEGMNEVGKIVSQDFLLDNFKIDKED